MADFKKADPTLFKQIIDKVRESDDLYKGNITDYSLDDYRQFRTFLSPDKKSGYAIKPDNELISVFSKERGRGKDLVKSAVKEGAKKLDAFDIGGKLPRLYGEYFDEVDRLKFADEYAPTQWNYDRLGRPDVVQMELNPEKAKKLMTNNDDSLMKQLKRMADRGMPMAEGPSMTQLMPPEEMKQALAQTDEADDLARRIQQRMSAKQLASSEAEGAADFMRKYGEKMKAPDGMRLGNIGDESARLGMKLPKEIANPRIEALKRLAGRAGKFLGPAAGVAGVLLQEELGGDEIVENPDIPAEIRAMAARAGEAEMREDTAEEQEFERKRQARDERVQALLRRLREQGE